MFAETKKCKSLQVSLWPEFNSAFMDAKAEKQGDLIVALIGEVRREKAEKKLPLNTQVKSITIYSGNADCKRIIQTAEGDIAGTIKANSGIRIVPETKPKGRKVNGYDVYIQTEY